MIRTSVSVIALFVLSACAARAPAPEAVDRTPSEARNGRAAIEFSVEYRLRCASDAAERTAATAKRTFFPEASPFREANGGLVPVMTARLQKLSDDLVSDAATAACGGSDRVAVAKPLKLRSGRWSAPLPFGCARDRCVISPYDDSVRDDVELSSLGTSFPDVEKRSAFGGSAADWNAAGTCAHPIRATACYGDCMSDAKSCTSKGGFVETLMSPSYEGTEAVSICGDVLYARLKDSKTSPALRTLACRSFFYEEALARSHPGLSCSAFRVDLPDCARF